MKGILHIFTFFNRQRYH